MHMSNAKQTLASNCTSSLIIAQVGAYEEECALATVGVSGFDSDRFHYLGHVSQ
jgi:hypothetical protein